MAEKFVFHVVSETHWDREWYLTYQQFRGRLVQLYDHLLKILAEDPDFKYFTLDGQTIVLEDFLDVRPAARDQIERYVREGRILIGPWYVLPDEFLEGAEAMVRNLMLGHKMASDFGAVMKIGYVPDTFGHIRQLPQILRGFGIDNAVVWRGVGEKVDKTEFKWISPDGSSVLAIYLPDGYCNAANLPLDPIALADRIERIGRRLRPMAMTKNILLMNGCDHLEPQAGLPAALRAANRELKDVQLVHSTLPIYVDAVRAIAPKLKDFSGELRSTARAFLLVGVLSTRIWIKQLNSRCEKLLEKWAEPLTAWASLAEKDNPRDKTHTGRMTAMNWLAWRYLLQNHPHDSICGCSIDDVHRDMVPRFRWVEEISELVVSENLRVLADHIDTTSKGNAKREGSTAVIVFNPSRGPRTDVAHVSIEHPTTENLNVLNEKGTKIPVQRLGVTLGDRRKIELAFVVKDLPAYGHRVYHISPSRNVHEPQIGKEEIENEFYKITANKRDGTINIMDKESGFFYNDCNRFVDTGDAGDEYNFSPPRKDMIVDRSTRVVECTCESGPVKKTLNLKMVYAVPESLSEDRGSRSSSLVDMPISTSVSLYPGVKRIDITTRVENTARDHLLRVFFPTSIATKKVYSEGHFDVLEHIAGAPSRVENWPEQPIGTFPQKSFTDVNDGTRGFLLANKGLPECEALEEGGKVTLALTLLRCVGWLSRGDLSLRPGNAGPTVATPEAQCMGHHLFEYAVIPHRGTWESAFAEAHNFNEPLRVMKADPSPGDLPSELSWIDIEPHQLVVSAIKVAERGNGVVVRLYNPSDAPIEGRLKLFRNIKNAFFVNLNEELIEEAQLDPDGAVKLEVKAKAVLSVLLQV